MPKVALEDYQSMSKEVLLCFLNRLVLYCTSNSNSSSWVTTYNVLKAVLNFAGKGGEDDTVLDFFVPFKFPLKIMSFPKKSFLVGHFCLCRLLKESAKYSLLLFVSSGSFYLLLKHPLLNLMSLGFQPLLFSVGVHYQPPGHIPSFLCVF